MSKQTPLLRPFEKKHRHLMPAPIVALEAGALHELHRSKKHMNSATLHLLELLHRV